MIRNNIILCGFMGSGKTTIGKLLSEKLNLKFIDLDKNIEIKENMSINNIFENYGEKYFRQLETKELGKIRKLKNHIISLGGGTVLSTENIKILKKLGKIFFLKVDYPIIKYRLKNDKTRPLFEKISFNEREKIYSSISDTIINANNTEEQICLDIIRSQIDNIDNKILNLFLERMNYSNAIGNIKNSLNIPIKNITRENEILNKLTSKTNKYNNETKKLFSEIIKISRDFQYKKKKLRQNKNK